MIVEKKQADRVFLELGLVMVVYHGVREGEVGCTHMNKVKIQTMEFKLEKSRI